MKKQLQDYDLIQFRDDVKRQLKGYRIKDWLIVAVRLEGGYKIYRVDGVPVLNSIFMKLDDAITFAEWLTDKFGDFFPIWEDYPNMDLFGLVKWSVEDGLRLYEMIKSLDDGISRIDTLKTVNDTYYKVEEDAKQWNRLG